MVVGNMGSPTRLDYSAVGDSVNVAARLEGLTKEYRVHVIVGEETRAAAGAAFVYRFLDRVIVKGRPEPVRAYEIVARAGEVPPARLEALRRFEEAVDLYRSRRWIEASELFAELEAQDPDEARRCSTLGGAGRRCRSAPSRLGGRARRPERMSGLSATRPARSGRARTARPPP